MSSSESGNKADTRIPRTLTIGINVDSADRLPKVGRQLAAFLKTVDHEHGAFDMNIAVAVEPTKEAQIGPFEFPDSTDDLTKESVEIIVINDDGYDGMFPEGAD